MASEANPEEGTIETENEDSEDEHLIATCENCGGEIMTIIGDDEGTWVHCNSEFLECPEPVKRKLSKAEMSELLEEAAELLREGATGYRVDEFLRKLEED